MERLSTVLSRVMQGIGAVKSDQEKAEEWIDLVIDTAIRRSAQSVTLHIGGDGRLSARIPHLEMPLASTPLRLLPAIIDVLHVQCGDTFQPSRRKRQSWRGTFDRPADQGTMLVETYVGSPAGSGPRIVLLLSRRRLEG